eukprot:434859-Alexandrium_andersonii.AAC.1
MTDPKVAQDLLSISGRHVKARAINEPLNPLGNNRESLLESRTGANPDRRSQPRLTRLNATAAH